MYQIMSKKHKHVAEFFKTDIAPLFKSFFMEDKDNLQHSLTILSTRNFLLPGL